MTFDHNTFAAQLDQYSGITVATKDGSYDWDQWKSTTGDLNKELDYDKGDFSYRTWYHEVGVMKNSAGMVVSCKIDFANGIGDDHIILLTGYMATSTGPQMIFVQASVQFYGDDDLNIMSDPITSGDLAQGMYDTLNSQISAMNLGSDNTSMGRKTLPDIAKANITAMIHSVS